MTRTGIAARNAIKGFPRSIGLGALLLLAFSAIASARDLAPAAARQWTATDPPIDFAHIATGEINRRGDAVGYHHRANGVDPPGARVLRIVQPPDTNGVYRARVALRDPATGVWVDKTAASTFFPDAMSDDEVIQAVLAAYHDGRVRGDGRFVGASGRGFAIEGWYQSGHINAAYPLRGP